LKIQNAKTTLNEIESNYDVSNIKVNNFFLWPYLRYFMGKLLLSESTNKKKELKKIDRIQRLKNSFYGFFNIFKTYDVIFFSTSKERTFQGKKSISKNINEIYKRYEKALLVEHAFDEMHFDIKTVSEKNIISLTLFELITNFIIRTKLINFKVSGKNIIDSINQKYNKNLDFLSNATYFIVSYHVFKFLLKLKKPKIIYITVWYGYGPIVKAAKDLGITTIEIQHGSFNENHYSYNMENIIDNSHYPEYILTYSQEYVDFLNKKELKNNNIFKAKAIGSYLESIKKNPPIKKDRFKEFKYIVSMSATINDGEKEYKLLEKLSNQLKDVLFIYIPRRQNNFQNKKNLLIVKKLTTSNYLPISDLHITVRSSCMFEAAFFEKKTLIYTPFIETEKITETLENKLREYHTLYKFIYRDDDLSSIIRHELNNSFVDNKEVIKQNLYEPGYEKNISDFINKIS
jgi:hypothetical protein